MFKKIKIKQHLYHFYWFVIFKRRGNITHTHTHTKKTMLIYYIFINIFNYFKIIVWKKIKKSSRYHCCPNLWNIEDSNAFSVKLFYILVFLIYKFGDLGKICKNEIYLFSFGQSTKKIITVKVEYLYGTKDDVG